MAKAQELQSIHYVNEMGVKFAPLELIDVAAEMRAHGPIVLALRSGRPY